MPSRCPVVSCPVALSLPVSVVHRPASPPRRCRAVPLALAQSLQLPPPPSAERAEAISARCCRLAWQAMRPIHSDRSRTSLPQRHAGQGADCSEQRAVVTDGQTDWSSTAINATVGFGDS